MKNSVFTSDFIDSVTETLNDNCPAGSGICMTRAELCEALGFDKDWEPVLGILIKANLISGYESRKGPNGGIGRIGEKSGQKQEAATENSNKVTDEFVTSLVDVLEDLCEDGAVVTRKTVAEVLGQPKSENLISQALKRPELQEKYQVVRGKHGGIKLRAPANEEVGEELTQEMADDETDAVSAAAV